MHTYTHVLVPYIGANLPWTSEAANAMNNSKKSKKVEAGKKLCSYIDTQIHTHIYTHTYTHI